MISVSGHSFLVSCVKGVYFCIWVYGENDFQAQGFFFGCSTWSCHWEKKNRGYFARLSILFIRYIHGKCAAG